MELGDRSQQPEKLVTEFLHHTKLCWYRSGAERGIATLKLCGGGMELPGEAGLKDTERKEQQVSEVPLGWPWQGLSAAEVGWECRGAEPLSRARR